MGNEKQSEETQAKESRSAITITLHLDTTEFEKSLARVKTELLEIISLQEKVAQGYKENITLNSTLKIDGKTIARALGECNNRIGEPK